MTTDPEVVSELVELFKLVADLCDGDYEEDTTFAERVAEEYERLMQIEAIRKFYGELVDGNPFNALI